MFRDYSAVIVLSFHSSSVLFIQVGYLHSIFVAIIAMICRHQTSTGQNVFKDDDSDSENKM